MDDKVVEFFGNVPTPIFVLLFLCIIGIIASGKIGAALGRALASITTWAFLLALNTPTEALPFMNTFLGYRTNGTIMDLINTDFLAFVYEMFFLFLFNLFIDTFLELVSSTVNSLGKSQSLIISLAGPWVVRIAACFFAGYGFIYFRLYLLSFIPKIVVSLFAIAIFVFMLLMILSPVIEFFLVLVKVAPFPLLTKIAEFVQKNTVKGILHAAFYGTFLTFTYFFIAQTGNPEYFFSQFE